MDVTVDFNRAPVSILEKQTGSAIIVMNILWGDDLFLPFLLCLSIDSVPKLHFPRVNKLSKMTQLLMPCFDHMPQMKWMNEWLQQFVM